MSHYDRIGGGTTMKAAVTVFYDRVTADERLTRFFDGIDLGRLRAHQRAFLSAALGGPDLFTGRDLEAAHAHLGVDDASYDAVTGHLLEVLTDFDVPSEVLDDLAERLEQLRGRIVTVPESGDDRTTAN